MDEDRLTIDPPLYLIGKMSSCWRCEAKMPVVAILAPNVLGTEGEICVLSDITELPEAILAYIQRRVPTFKLTYSKTVGLGAPSTSRWAIAPFSRRPTW